LARPLKACTPNTTPNAKRKLPSSGTRAKITFKARHLQII
jgi:hypothetical protein